ncbi:MAG: AcvB/VirJ family lysyl-phosphatidylglycerol hydrolase [Dokdonella sp.]
MNLTGLFRPALLVLALALTAQTAAAETLDYGLFGTLHLSRPSTVIGHTALLFSDSSGWTSRQDQLSAALAGQGAFVVGIDLPIYLKRMEALKDKCAYPAGHVEDVAHWIERHEGLADYTVPLVVGDGAGATFAYALAAQAPAGTFDGLITLGWDASLRFPKAFCAGDAGTPTVAAANGGFRVVPVAKLPLRWLPRPFATQARITDLGGILENAWNTLALVLAPSASAGAGTDVGLAYQRWRQREDAAVRALPDDVADLPLTDIAPTASASHQIAIVITGDGGWAGLDRGVADALTAQGTRVIGFSTLKYFWQKQSADGFAGAIARVIAHYGKADPAARFVLIGYSFGASLVPVAINRLPEAVRERVQGGVMISPDDEAVFEIHVGDWFGSTHHEGTLPIGPEIATTKLPLVCVHGADEDDSFCLKPQPSNVRVASLPGGHHYEGDYAALGALIARSLPAQAQVAP